MQGRHVEVRTRSGPGLDDAVDVVARLRHTGKCMTSSIWTTSLLTIAWASRAFPQRSVVRPVHADGHARAHIDHARPHTGIRQAGNRAHRTGTDEMDPGVTLASIGLWAGFSARSRCCWRCRRPRSSPSTRRRRSRSSPGSGRWSRSSATRCSGRSRTGRSRASGRRLPWVVGGALVGAASLVWLAFASSVVTVVIGWVGVQASLNAMLAALTASIPDLVPVRQRGLVGGWVGAAQTLGVVAGVGVAGAGGGRSRRAISCSAALVVLPRHPLRLAQQRPVARPGASGALRARAVRPGLLTDPREHRTSGWAWGPGSSPISPTPSARGTCSSTSPTRSTTRTRPPRRRCSSLVYAGLLVVSTVIAGVWSDRVGRRRLRGLGRGRPRRGVLPAGAAADLHRGAGRACLYGIGFGIYTSVDFALITQVLPDADGTARDLGSSSPPPCLRSSLRRSSRRSRVVGADKAGGYRVVYLLGAVIALLGGVLVQRIRSVPNLWITCKDTPLKASKVCLCRLSQG